jgi:hypothetical protein
MYQDPDSQRSLRNPQTQVRALVLRNAMFLSRAELLRYRRHAVHLLDWRRLRIAIGLYIASVLASDRTVV